MKLTEKLFREEAEYRKAREKKEWISVQRKLLIDHEFRTNTARLLRSIALEDQIAGLQTFYE